jgi:hypothetical protein
MKRSLNHIAAGSLIAAIGLTLSACGPTVKEWSPDRQKVGYAQAYRQLPPQPVYNRLRWVYAPEVLPARETSSESSAPTIMPVFHLDLKNATLEEAARTLAATTRFSSYCSSTIADRKISINRLGTVDELAGEIAGAAGITVQIDRQSQTVRFLPKLAPQPEFTTEESSQKVSDSQVLRNEVTSNEHQSVN